MAQYFIFHLAQMSCFLLALREILFCKPPQQICILFSIFHSGMRSYRTLRIGLAIAFFFLFKKNKKKNQTNFGFYYSFHTWTVL